MRDLRFSTRREDIKLKDQRKNQRRKYQCEYLKKILEVLILIGFFVKIWCYNYLYRL